MIQKAYDAIRRFFDYRGRREAQRLQLLKEVQLAEAARQEQMLEILEAVLSRVQSNASETTQATIEIAKGIQENAKALNRWFALFEQAQGEGFSHVVRNEEEYEQALKRDEERFKKMMEGFGVKVENSVDPHLANLVSTMFDRKDFG